jgi:hypothetical protein
MSQVDLLRTSLTTLNNFFLYLRLFPEISIHAASGRDRGKIVTKKEEQREPLHMVHHSLGFQFASCCVAVWSGAAGVQVLG